ncbi:hypothetical protein C8J56DRAFT_959753 [Mycena floridula]|nr:hypothetical protein C8J56DRAFT_959753 [Mycena floridula]
MTMSKTSPLTRLTVARVPQQPPNRIEKDCPSVVLVGNVMSVKATQSDGILFHLDDATGVIKVMVSLPSALEVAKTIFTLPYQDYGYSSNVVVRVIGIITHFNSQPMIKAELIGLASDPHEPYLHILQMLVDDRNRRLLPYDMEEIAGSMADASLAPPDEGTTMMIDADASLWQGAEDPNDDLPDDDVLLLGPSTSRDASARQFSTPTRNLDVQIASPTKSLMHQDRIFGLPGPSTPPRSARPLLVSTTAPPRRPDVEMKSPSSMKHRRCPSDSEDDLLILPMSTPNRQLDRPRTPPRALTSPVSPVSPSKRARLATSPAKIDPLSSLPALEREILILIKNYLRDTSQSHRSSRYPNLPELGPSANQDQGVPKRFIEDALRRRRTSREIEQALENLVLEAHIYNPVDLDHFSPTLS